MQAKVGGRAVEDLTEIPLLGAGNGAGCREFHYSIIVILHSGF